MPDWSVANYTAFHDLRLRPALDLLAGVPDPLPEGAIIDLGCGAGAAACALKTRWPNRILIGVDSSDTMLDQARLTGLYHRIESADIAQWKPVSQPALIFSNAALNWLPDHYALFPRLLSLLLPGGYFAAQMPRQAEAASHALWRSLAAELFPDRFDWSDWRPEVGSPGQYASILGDAQTLDIWESEYLQKLPNDVVHPVRSFTQSTYGRRVLDNLVPLEREGIEAAYETAIAQHYPRESDGSVWFGFRRLFVIAGLSTAC